MTDRNAIPDDWGRADSSRFPSQFGWRFSLRAALAAMLLIGLLLGLLIPAVKSAREAARKAQCTNHLKQIVLAVLNYEAANRSFPPAYLGDAQGKPMHSWRVLITPYLESSSFYSSYRFSEPWDGPNNRKLSNFGWSYYGCPSDLDHGNESTSYVAVVGPETLWPGAKSHSGLVPDGPSQTMLIVELADSGIHWMEPRDITFAELIQMLKDRDKPLSSHHPARIHAAMADGSVYLLPETLTEEQLRALLTSSGKEPPIGVDELSSP